MKFRVGIDILVDILVGIFELTIQLALGLLTIYALAWAFGPYLPLETNAAGLCAFLALACYWYWKFSNLGNEKRFWEIF